MARITGRTVAEVESHNRKFAQSLADNLFDIGGVPYEPQTVKGWRDGAEEILLERGVDGAMEVYRAMPAGESEGRKTALGVAIATELYAQNRLNELTTFGTELTENIGNAAQELRAAALISRLNPAFAQIRGDKITQKAHGRPMTVEERDATLELAQKLQEAADAHALSQAMLAEAQNTSKRLEEHVKELEGLLEAERKRNVPRNDEDLQKALDEARKEAAKYKAMAEAQPRVKGPKQLQDLRKKLETQRPDLVALIQHQFPGSPLKSAKPGKVLLAPNGRPSKLNEHLYNLVRTPEFKNFFGDWENDPENASKAVDENGEPQIYKHGTGSHRDFDHFSSMYTEPDAYYIRPDGRGGLPAMERFMFTTHDPIANLYAGAVEGSLRWQKMMDPYGDQYDFSKPGEAGARVIPVFLNVRKPFRPISAGSESLFGGLSYDGQHFGDNDPEYANNGASLVNREVRRFYNENGRLPENATEWKQIRKHLSDALDGIREDIADGDRWGDGRVGNDKMYEAALADFDKRDLSKFAVNMSERMQGATNDWKTESQIKEHIRGFFERNPFSAAVEEGPVGSRYSRGDWPDTIRDDYMFHYYAGDWRYVEQIPGVAEIIKANGYDGFLTYEGNGFESLSSEGVGVFKPEQIKSIFNEGTFDPENAEILKKSPVPAKGFDPEYDDVIRTVYPYEARKNKHGAWGVWNTEIDRWQLFAMRSKADAELYARTNGYDVVSMFEVPPEVEVRIQNGDWVAYEDGAYLISAATRKGFISALNRIFEKQAAAKHSNAAPGLTAPDTPSFKDWFKDSKVVDENGNPLPLVHATTEDFDTFERRPKTKHDIGFHFGTPGQANRIAELRGGKKKIKAPSRSMPVYLSIQNPMRMKDITHHNDPFDLLRGLADATDLDGKPAFAKGEVASLGKELGLYGYGGGTRLAYDHANHTLRNEHVDRIRQFIKDHGFDGIVYKNAYENKYAPADSWIAFDPTQIKSATGNNGNFDPNEGSILKKVTPQDLDIDSQTLDALIRVSAAKLIDDLPKGMTPGQFDGWLRMITNDQLGALESSYIHAKAFELTRTAGTAMSPDARALLRNRLEHAKRAEMTLGTREELRTQREAARAQAKGKIKEGEAFRDDKFANRMLEVASDIDADDAAVMMAFGLRETPAARKLRALYDKAVPDGGDAGFQKALNGGKALLDLTKDSVERERAEVKAGQPLSDRELADLKRKITEQRTEERKQQKALKQQFDRLAMTTKGKVGHYLLSTYNLSRSLMFSGDFGFMFAQGLPLAFTHPTAWFKAITTGVPASMTDKRFEQAVTKLYDMEERKRLESGGTDFEQIGNIADFNETFMSDLGMKIPVVKQTNRAHSLTTDLFRLFGGAKELADLDQMYKDGKLGRTDEENVRNYNRSKEFLLKKWVNVMSGKGYLGEYHNLAKVAAQFGSAPRYTLSSFQLLWYANPARAAFLPKGARKIMMKNTAKLWTGLAVMLTLLAKLGLINTDPEDKDFGVIDAGKLLGISDMKINPMRAIKEPIRLALALPAKLLYYYGAGNQEGVDRILKHYYAQFWADTYGGPGAFWKTKAHPTISIAGMLWSGKNFIGEPAGWMDILPFPLGVKETTSALSYDRKQAILKSGQGEMRSENFGRAAASLLTNFFGGGANSYPDSDTTTATKQMQSMGTIDTRPQAERDQSMKANQLERLIREGYDVSEDIKAALQAGQITKKQAGQLMDTLTDDLGSVQKKFGMTFTEKEKQILTNNRRALKILDYVYGDKGKIDWKRIDAGLKFATPRENYLNDQAATAEAEAVILNALLRSTRITGSGISTDDVVEMYKARESKMTDEEKRDLRQRLEQKAANAAKGGTLDPDELERIRTVIPGYSPPPKKEKK